MKSKFQCSTKHSLSYQSRPVRQQIAPLHSHTLFPFYFFLMIDSYITFPHLTLLLWLQDVNSVAVSPNDKLLASGSQDRTAKLWSLAGEGNLGLLGVFRGHRRGIWAVCFSPVDQVLATSSADGTTKLWSLQDFSCLKVCTQCCWCLMTFHFHFLISVIFLTDCIT